MNFLQCHREVCVWPRMLYFVCVCVNVYRVGDNANHNSWWCIRFAVNALTSIWCQLSWQFWLYARTTNFYHPLFSQYVQKPPEQPTQCSKYIIQKHTEKPQHQIINGTLMFDECGFVQHRHNSIQIVLICTKCAHSNTF